MKKKDLRAGMRIVTQNGATYVVTTYNTQIRVSQIWLCTVTKHVFGGTFLENICFNVIN